MMKFDKFKASVPVLCAVLVVFTSCIQLCQCESYQQEAKQQSQQQQNNNNNNGYSSPSTPPFVQSHRYRNSNHQTRTAGGGWGYPTESRTVVPLFLPMILFVGIVLLLFFAVVGSAAVAGGAAGIGRRVGVPAHRNSFARDFSTSAALARDVLSSEQCVERISCEVFRVAKGYKAQNWMLRALSFLPEKSTWTRRISRTLSARSKPVKTRRSRKENCSDFQCSAVTAFVHTVKKLHE